MMSIQRRSNGTAARHLDEKMGFLMGTQRFGQELSKAGGRSASSPVDMKFDDYKTLIAEARQLRAAGRHDQAQLFTQVAFNMVRADASSIE